MDVQGASATSVGFCPVNVDWAAFTPTESLFGGALVGLAAALLLMRGIAASPGNVVARLIAPVMPRARALGWRLAFLGGVIVSPLVYGLFASVPLIRAEAPGVLVAVAGMLIGVGTRLARGCISGHGLSGLARMSRPSMVALTCCALAGGLTVYVLRHVLVA